MRYTKKACEREVSESRKSQVKVSKLREGQRKPRGFDEQERLMLRCSLREKIFSEVLVSERPVMHAAVSVCL